MAKQKVTVEVEVPEGWELTGEYRTPAVGESYLYYGAAQRPLNTDYWHPQFLVWILRKIRTPQVGEVWQGKLRRSVHALILPGGLAVSLDDPYRDATPFPFDTLYWSFAFPSTKEWAESLKGEGK